MAIGTATILGSFAARLGLDTNEYAKGVLQAQSMNAALGQSITNFLVNPLLGAVDGLKNAARGAIGLGAEVLATAEDVQRLGQRTGATTDLIQALEVRMGLAGYATEQGGQALLKLAAGMEEARQNGGPLAETFRRLGVDINSTGPVDGALAQLLDGLYAIEDPGVRSAVAMKLLGEEAGPRLVNAVGGGSGALRQMIEEGRRFGAVLGTDAVNQLADFNTTLGYTDVALAQLKRNLVSQFLLGFVGEFGSGTESVLELAESINQDLGPSIRRFGKDIGESAGNVRELTQDLRDLFDLLRRDAEGLDAAREVVTQGQFGGWDIPGLRQNAQAIKWYLDLNFDAASAAYRFVSGGR